MRRARSVCCTHLFDAHFSCLLCHCSPRVSSLSRLSPVLVQRLRVYLVVDPSPAGPIHFLFGDRLDLRVIHAASPYAHATREKARERVRRENEIAVAARKMQMEADTRAEAAKNALAHRQ